VLAITNHIFATLETVDKLAVMVGQLSRLARLIMWATRHLELSTG